ncbi:MAG: ParA family protein [Sphingobacterium sp.]|uniref:ParA family protein n=1 Tax=Sphingobacterium sp. JB170 TaxID=1434842 RepID=UPI00097EC166|nr:ParA family protein [Sphingobacterium sp. JB170]SJN26979.1 Chromosome (plasmid) partitioning protein ParA [Sphingobacterium sp. JB170]
MTKIISILNHKGGTGKTTSTINIGACLARADKKVLLIDIDPQTNLTEGLGVYDIERSIYDSLRENTPLPILKINDNLDLVPSSLDLVAIEMELISAHARELKIKMLLDPIKDQYDYILFDCPPSLGLLTINALVPSNSVLIPLQAEYFAYRGVDRMVGIINDMREYFNPDLDVEGVFLTKYKPNLILGRNIKDEIEKVFEDKLFNTYVRENVSLAEAQTLGVDIFTHAPDSNGAKDYQNLVNEILNIG